MEIYFRSCTVLRSCAVLLQSVHAIAVQPKKPLCKLSQIVSVGSDGKASCATESVCNLSFQRRHFSPMSEKVRGTAASDARAEL